ncbi:MAG: 4Fe-4S binding protein [Myxococcota bacterium]|nr:4Fe-4S binding protein [Myxococcota bacterium]
MTEDRRHQTASHKYLRPIVLRRASQGVNLLLWLVLLFGPIYGLLPSLVPLDLYLSLDPLSGITAALAGRVLLPALLLGGLTLLLTLLLGRVFCGWLCPLGTLIDLLGGGADLLRQRLRGRGRVRRASPGAAATALPAGRLVAALSWRGTKLVLLLLLLVAALGGLQLTWLVDPLPLVTRAFGLAGLPQTASPVAPPPDGLVLAGRLAALLLGVILLAAVLQRRWWCRTACPLGALLALVSRFSWYRLLSRGCTHCGRCLADCPMGLRDLRTGHEDPECIRCYRCAESCPQQGVELGRPTPEAAVLPALPRRAVIAGLASGAVVGSAHLALGSSRPLAAPGTAAPPLRPPWALPEDEFLARCVRCGACVRVCPTGTLRPFFLEEGPLALWTPELVPTLGGCKPECNLCAQACPTGAIAPFDLVTKYQVKAGIAKFDLRRCVAYGPAERPCSACLPVCPTAAFRIHRCMHTGIPKPRAVLADRCVGCGLCEYVCTIETHGEPALTTSGRGRGEPTRL